MYTICTYILGMRCEWDEAKRKANLRKHGVEFADAVGVFDDPNAITIEDRGHVEERVVALGTGALCTPPLVRAPKRSAPAAGIPNRLSTRPFAATSSASRRRSRTRCAA